MSLEMSHRFLKGAERPERTGECICQEPGNMATDFIVMHMPGVRDPVWYARKSCPIHGLKIIETDPSGPPATATSSETSTTPS